MTWVLIQSWHGVRWKVLDNPPRWTTLCGRKTYSDPVDDLPAGKSCETCLRIVARKADG